MKRKMIAFTAAVCMTAALIPTASFAEGEAITRAYIENGNTVAEVNAESGTVIAADYTGGALTAVKYADVSDAVNGTVTIEGIEADKVFLWDSLAGMTPLCAPVIVGGTDESPSPAPTATTEATVSPSPSAEPDASASPEPTSAPTAEATTTPLPTPTTGATATPTPTAIATVSPSPTPTTEVTTSPAPTATTEATVLPTPTPTTEATVSPMPTPTTEATVSPMPTPTIGATVSPSPSVEPDVTESPSPTTIPTILPEKIYDDWLQGQANDTSTDGLKEVTEYEGKTALGVCRNVYKLYGETMVSGASMTFETYAYYASGSAGFRIVLESASASEAQNSGKIVEAVTAGSDGKFGTAGETTLTSTKTGWFKAVVKVSYSGTDPTVTASLYDPDGAAVFENTNVPVPSDVTDKNVKAIRLVSRESADSGIYTYFADMDASFTGAATPDPSVPTPSPKPTPHPTAPPKATTAPTAEPTFPTVNIPESKAWTVNDTALNEKVLAVTTKGEALEPYDGLNGYGEWTNLNVTELKYTHNGTAYTFTHCWQAGTGSATERNFYFTPEAECTVTVAYQSPKKETDTSDRPLYICQGGVDETNRLITGTDPGTDAAPAEMSVNITDTSKGDVYIVGGSSNKYVYGIFVDYKQSKLYGTITHEGGTDMEGAKIVFTDASDPNNKYEVDFAATYAIAVENGKTYNVSVVDADGAEIAGLQPVTSTVTVNGETRHDVKIADLNSTLVTGDVVVHEYTPNDETTLDLSGVTLKFTDKTDNTVYTANKIENNRYSALLKPGKTYTVTAENADGYTLSPLSGEYELPSGETGCFKNILLTENLGTVPFTETIEVGWDRTYTRINDAVAAIKNMTDRPEGEDGRVTILLDNGVYQEQAIIDADYVTLKAAIDEYKPIITFYYGIGYRYYSAAGESGDDAEHAKGGYYSEDLAVQKTQKGNVDRWGPVVRVTGDYFKAENVIFANSFNCQIVQAELDDGVEPSIYSDTNSKPDRTAKNFDPLTTSAVERAAAMAADGNNYEFKNCEFISSQDTLFTNNVGYFKDCYIEGGTDYIFGGNSVIFDNCTLAWHGYTGNAKGGYITACKTAETPTAGTPNLKANGYLMRNCTVTKSKYYKHSFEAGGWGRNWGGENCQVVFDGVTIASGTDVPGTWVAMRKAEENKPFSFSILYVNNVKKADGTVVNSSGTDFNPNGTMSSNGYSIMSDSDYFGEWTPSYSAK